MSGAGSLAGALALIWWPTQARASRIWLGALVGPLALATMALTREPVVAVIASGFTSAAFSSQLNLGQAMMQESTPGDFRGRVMSLNGIAFNSTGTLAGLASAGVAVAIGLPAVMLACAACYLVLAVLVLKFAAGGIDRVVAESQREYQAIAAATPVASPSAAR
jgi:hypothetical protein